MSEPEVQSFTGRQRQRRTSKSVIVADRSAGTLITVGGLGTILAVLGVAVFLVWVVLPLFLPADVADPAMVDMNWPEEPLHVGVDEYRTLGWALFRSGALEVFRLDTGERRFTQQLFEPGQLVSASFLLAGPQAVFGLADGTLRTGTVEFATEVRSADSFPPQVRRAIEEAPPGTVASFGNGIVQRTPAGDVRLQQLRVELGEATVVAEGPVRRVRLVLRTSGPLIVALAEEPGPPARTRLVAIRGEERSNFLTGRTSVTFSPPFELPFEALGSGVPRYLEVTGAGTDVFVAWASGELLRVQTASQEDAYVAEKGRLVGPGASLTALRFLLGNRTLVWGDSSGAVRAGFLLRLTDYEGPGIDGLELEPRATTRLVETKRLAEAGDAAAMALAPSARSRLLFSSFADGRVRLTNVTNEAELATVRLADDGGSSPSGPFSHLVMTPKEDGLVALTGGRLFHAGFDPGYPEASFKALFRPVWYEGYNEPLHVWQSSSGTDDFEPKLGLYPLIFGTLKATFYSMLLGAPLALLAAIYTSEFLHARTKAVIKPAIELMASLPSVVLGFLAALVFAPFLEDVVPATLALFLTLPLAFLLGAYTWQMLPAWLTLRFAHWRFGWIALAAPLGIALALWWGPLFERLLFGGDIRGWLAWDAEVAAGAERFADATGGWLLLWLPLSALIVVWFGSRFVSPWMRERGAGWDRRRFALADACRFLLGLATTVALAVAISALLDASGFDPRGSYVDTFVQRNALVVGFVMGFAIIPIIYTISEDALSTVPEHLRSASLGAGATPWQTAVRIVIPTAMSGLFSALMVGLGRAVGETMIVLMAAGNTPVLEWNIFEGFRTLSANIAVELPEAVKDSTHYRTLFLAALVLFVMTFIVNTVAEIVRLRFRKRAYQL